MSNGRISEQSINYNRPLGMFMHSTENLSFSQMALSAVPLPQVGMVGRRQVPNVGGGGAEKRGLSTHHISPLAIRTPVRLRSSAVKTGETVDKFVYDDTGQSDSSGIVQACSAADNALPTHTAKFDGKIEIWRGGCLVRAKHQPLHRLTTGTIKKLSRRGSVGGFSAAARRRLLLTLGKIKNDLLPVFVTLTYPGDFPHEAATWKRHLDNFFKRMKRKFPDSSALWKLEPQKRGAPHYHLLTWGVDLVDLRSWVSLAWYQVVGSGDERHLRAGVRCEAVRSWRGVRSYSAKYLGKRTYDDGSTIDNAWLYPGRWWGLYNRECLPWAACESYTVPRHESIIFLRTMRRYAGIKSRDFSSLSIMVNNASFWSDHLHKIVNQS